MTTDTEFKTVVTKMTAKLAGEMLTAIEQEDLSSRSLEVKISMHCFDPYSRPVDFPVDITYEVVWLDGEFQHIIRSRKEYIA